MKPGIYYSKCLGMSDKNWSGRIIIHRLMPKTAEVTFVYENGTHRDITTAYRYPLVELKNELELDNYVFIAEELRSPPYDPLDDEDDPKVAR